MFLSDDREDPARSLDTEVKDRWLSTFRSKLDPETLGVDHVLRRLWQRRDFFATTELLTIGASLERLANQAPYLRPMIEAARDSDRPNSLAAIHEITAAALFQDPSNPSRLTPKNNPAFDFGIELPGSRLVRVSCKLRMESAEETLFRDLSEALFANLATSIPARMDVRCFIGWEGDSLPAITTETIEGHRAALGRALGKMRSSGRGGALGPHGATFEVTPLGPIRGMTLSTKIGSYHQITAFSHKRHEQKRVLNQVEAGIKGFKKHHPGHEPGKANVLLVKVGSALRRAEAEPLIRRMLADAPEVSAVYLLRRQIVGRVDSPSSLSIETELAEIENPVARVSIRSLLPEGETIRANAPLGAVSMQEAPFQLFVGDDNTQIPYPRDTHLAVRTRFYVHPVPGASFAPPPDTEICFVVYDPAKGAWGFSEPFKSFTTRLIAI